MHRDEATSVHVLVVDDDPLFLRTLGRLRTDHPGVRFELRFAEGVEAALRAIDDSTQQFDIVLFDVRLPAVEDAHRLIREIAQRAPFPRLVAMSGSATSEQSFEMGQAGVCAYFTKTALAALGRDLLPVVAGAAYRYTPDLEHLARMHVGTTSMRELKQRVGDAMYFEALARAAGSKRGAAKLLGVKRQALQRRARQV